MDFVQAQYFKAWRVGDSIIGIPTPRHIWHRWVRGDDWFPRGY